MARVTGSHLIGKALKLEGVSNIFTLAGDHILPVMNVMSGLDFRFIDTRHEQATVLRAISPRAEAAINRKKAARG